MYLYLSLLQLHTSVGSSTTAYNVCLSVDVLLASADERGSCIMPSSSDRYLSQTHSRAVPCLHTCTLVCSLLPRDLWY